MVFQSLIEIEVLLSRINPTRKKLKSQTKLGDLFFIVLMKRKKKERERERKKKPKLSHKDIWFHFEG